MFGESRCHTRRSQKLFMPKHNKLARISHCLSESSRSIGTRGFSQTKYVQVFSHRGICECKLTPEIRSKRQGLLIPASNLLTHQNSSALAVRTVAPQTLILFFFFTGCLEGCNNAAWSRQNYITIAPITPRTNNGEDRMPLGIGTFVSGEQFSGFVFSHRPPPPPCVQVFPLKPVCTVCGCSHSAGLTGLPCHIIIILIQSVSC